ncbi:MAG: molybdopterin-dependent oxidoreductase [Rubrivivax sp.]
MRNPPHLPLRPDLARRAGLRAAGTLGIGVALATLWPAPRAARAAAPPEGPVVLVIRGRVRRPNDGAVVSFDMGALGRLPQLSFSTRTPWYSGPRQFTGPLMRDVLESAGAQGSVLRVSALNDYRVDVPFDDAQQHELILARLLDGQAMPVRDKGPLFMVYPFDDHSELRSAVYYSRSVWQVKSIEVV